MGESATSPGLYYTSARPELAELILSAGAAHGRVLDIGCGEGMLGQRLLGDGCQEVWGVEPVEAVAQSARSRLTGVTCGLFPECIDQLPGPFDLVIMADCLEHIACTEDSLEAVRTILSPGGKLALSVPNVSHYSVIEGLLRGEWDYADSGILDRTHLRFFTPSSLDKLLRAAAWCPITHSEVLHILPGRRGLPLTWALRRFLPHTLVFQMLVLAKDARAECL